MLIDDALNVAADAGRPERSGGAEAEIARRIRRSIDYMLGHLTRRVQVAELAAQASVSPSHFFALFKRWTGSPPLDYFTRLRMRHSCELLDSTTLSVKEVSAAMGYDDPFYFSRVFKLVNGVAPTEYRSLPECQKESIRHCGLKHSEVVAACPVVVPLVRFRRHEPVRRLQESFA